MCKPPIDQEQRTLYQGPKRAGRGGGGKVLSESDSPNISAREPGALSFC